MRMTLAAFTAMLIAAPVFAAEGDAYGTDFYRADFWGGEYPRGFTVKNDIVLKLRAAIAPESTADIDCPVKAGETYHPWNQSRVAAQALGFVSFTRIEDMKVSKPIETTVINEAEGTEVPLKLKKGDTWRYLAYYGEGAYLMEYDGVSYTGSQDLFEVSTSNVPEADRVTHEWMRINCDNNRWGWLMLSDLDGNPAIDGPNITGYPEAADLQ